MKFAVDILPVMKETVESGRCYVTVTVTWQADSAGLFYLCHLYFPDNSLLIYYFIDSFSYDLLELFLAIGKVISMIFHDLLS
jgi:hypothetical protein